MLSRNYFFSLVKKYAVPTIIITITKIIPTGPFIVSIILNQSPRDFIFSLILLNLLLYKNIIRTIPIRPNKRPNEKPENNLNSNVDFVNIEIMTAETPVTNAVSNILKLIENS